MNIPTKQKYDIKFDLVRIYGSRCYYCDRYFYIGKLTLDHIYPQSKTDRKKTNVGTCVLACYPCNLRKGNRIISIEEFRKEVMGDKYYQMDDRFYVASNKPYKSKKRKYRKGEEFAHNVVYPKNPIVKHKMTLKELLRKFKII